MALIVTPADITSALLRTDATADNIDRAVDACPGLNAVVRDQWKRWLDGYRAFSKANRDLSFFTLGLPAIGDQVVAYEHELATWNETVSHAACVNAQPTIVTHDEVAARNAAATVPSLDGSTKLLIGGGLALALLITIRTVIR